MASSDQHNDMRPAPPGWVLRTYPGAFSTTAGPFYFRDPGPVPGVGFFAETRHQNLGEVVHGGALLTLADMALFDVCFRATDLGRAVTVTLNAEFLGPGPLGEFIEATGELTKEGKSLLFVRGLITARAKPVMAFSGTLKRVG